MRCGYMWTFCSLWCNGLGPVGTSLSMRAERDNATRVEVEKEEEVISSVTTVVIAVSANSATKSAANNNTTETVVLKIAIAL